MEILKDYPIGVLTSKNYKLEVEESAKKARCAIAIKDNIDYKRRSDLEEVDSGIVVIDINSKKNYRLINVYRQFNPPPPPITAIKLIILVRNYAKLNNFPSI